MSFVIYEASKKTCLSDDLPQLLHLFCLFRFTSVTLSGHFWFTVSLRIHLGSTAPNVAQTAPDFTLFALLGCSSHWDIRIKSMDFVFTDFNFSCSPRRLDVKATQGISEIISITKTCLLIRFGSCQITAPMHPGISAGTRKPDTFDIKLHPIKCAALQTWAKIIQCDAICLFNFYQ